MQSAAAPIAAWPRFIDKDQVPSPGQVSHQSVNGSWLILKRRHAAWPIRSRRQHRGHDLRCGHPAR